VLGITGDAVWYRITAYGKATTLSLFLEFLFPKTETMLWTQKT
jgi:hypothetical protein